MACASFRINLNDFSEMAIPLVFEMLAVTSLDIAMFLLSASSSICERYFYYWRFVSVNVTVPWIVVNSIISSDDSDLFLKASVP